MDNQFSPENIDKAVDSYNSNQIEVIEFLNEWSEDISSLSTAIYLIQNSKKSISRFISSTLIKNKIPLYWNQLEAEQRTEFRDSLLFAIFNSNNLDNNTIYNLIDALCSIALFDWPDDYPAFSNIFSPPNDSNIKNSLTILSNFLKKVDISDFITHVHRSSLRELIISKFQENIMLIIGNYINEPELSLEVLTIYNYMLRWSSTDDVINFELFIQFINQFLTNEDTCEKAVNCLRSIFLSRSDSKINFGNFSPFLINLLSEGLFQNQKAITTNIHIIGFAIDFLKTYTPSLEILFFYDQIKEENEILINNSIELLYQTMRENEISPLTLHDNLVNLCQIILSIPSEDIIDNFQYEFLSLWNEIIRRIRKESEYNNPTKPASELYLPLFNEIRQSLFNIVSYIGDDDNDHHYYLESTLCSIYYLNPTDFFDFLREQPLSTQFCYSLGAFELITDMEKQENIVLIISELLENSNDCESSEFQCALLYGISRCGGYLASDHQLFSQFIEFIFNSLSESDITVSTAASKAFKFLIDNNFDLFKFDYDFIVKSIVSQSENFILNLGRKAAKNVYQACTCLINANYDEEGITPDQIDSEKVDEYRENMIQKLFEPIVSIIQNIDQFHQETVETSLDIISKCCHKKGDSTILYDDLYDSESIVDFIFYTNSMTENTLNYLYIPLCQLAAEVIADLDFPDSFIEHLLIALSVVQSNFPFDQISSQIKELFELMKSREKIEDCFFKYFYLIRNSFNEIDSLYTDLHQELIVPYLLNEEQPCNEMFQMISNFSPDLLDFDWMTEITFKAVNELDSNVANSALKMYSSLLKKLSHDQCIGFLNGIVFQLIPLIINSIVNLNYKSLFEPLVELLRCIIMLPVSKKIKEDEMDADLNVSFKQSIISSLLLVASEPENGFFDNFANYLLNVRDLQFEFFDIFQNLLIVLKKYFPCDFAVFQPRTRLRIINNNRNHS